MADSKYVPQGPDQLTQLMAAFSGGNKTTQTTTANQAPLLQVLQALQAQNASNPEAIMASLMQQFAGKIPQLNTATAVGGARVGGAGAPMTGQMQKLLAQATIAAQQQIAQQQNENLRTQAGVASSVADTSRSSSTVQKSDSGPIGDLMKLRVVNNMIGKATGFDPMEEILRRTKSGLNIGEGFAGMDVMDSLSTQMASSLDPLAGFGGADLGSLASSLDFGSAGTSLDAAINAMNTNVDFGSFSAGDAAAGAASPADLSGPLNYAPVLSVLNYAANPGSFEDIFELGQGNVPMDLAQLTGGYATASGLSSLAGLGSLPYAQLLGPAGIILAGIAGAFVGEESDLETHSNWFRQFLPGKEMGFLPDGSFGEYQREGSKSALEIANFLNEYGNVRAQLGDKIPGSVQLYLDKLGSGGPLLNTLGDWSSDADRAYAYQIDSKAQTSKWNANRTPDWQRGAPLDRNPYGIQDESLLDYTPIMDRIRALESAGPAVNIG